MAVVAGTALTYSRVGIREDLEDVIYNISPKDTPFVSMIGRGKAKQRTHEWQTDTLAAPAANVGIEGDDASFSTPAATTRLSNRCQILKKTVLVSGTMRAVDAAGREDEFEFQAAKRMAELKKDLEFATVQNQSSSAGSAGVGATMGSLEAMLVNNSSRGTNGSAPGHDGSDWVKASDGTQRTFTETLLKTVLQSVYSAGGDPDTLMVGPFNKSQASAFAGIATQQIQNSKSARATILASAEVYIGEFGELKIIPNRVQRDRTAFVLQKDKFAVAYLRPFKMEKLAKTGDADKAQIIVEATLVGRAPNSSGAVADLTTS